MLSKTQAHEVVVPWQHQAVAEGEASVGTKEEAVDVDGHGDAGENMLDTACGSRSRFDFTISRGQLLASSSGARQKKTR